jgi:hypothetical protein
MKKVCISCLFVVASFFVSAQQITYEPHTKDYYLHKKEKTQMTASILLLGGGVSIWISTKINDFSYLTGLQTNGAQAAFLGLGFIAAAVSIPVFVVSGIYNRKARRATVFLENKNINLTSNGNHQ